MLMPMIRLIAVLPLLMVAGCADQSRGAALNECRLRYDIRAVVDRGPLVTACMQAKSFAFEPSCAPSTSEYEWDSDVRTFAYCNPQCYRPTGTERWIATALSPM